MIELEEDIEQIEVKDTDMENLMKEKTSNESENLATLERKQISKLLMMF